MFRRIKVVHERSLVLVQNFIVLYKDEAFVIQQRRETPMVMNPREGDSRTAILKSVTTVRRLTVAQYVIEQVTQLHGLDPTAVTDDLVLGYDANRIAFELEREAKLPDGTVEDKLPTDRDATVGDLIRCGIEAYNAVNEYHGAGYWRLCGGRYMLPG